KYYDGIIPKAEFLNERDEHTLGALQAYPKIISNSIERYRFREASQELMNLARLGNKYLADEEPWKLIKTDQTRVKTVMYVALQIAAGLAVLSEPFLPFTSNKLKKILNADQLQSDWTWRAVLEGRELLEAGHSIGKAELLFARIEDSEIQQQLEKLQATKALNESEEATVEPQKETIGWDDFAKLDMRVGTVIEASKMPKTKKLMVLKVDTGLDVRTIVSGIAEHFSAEELIGKRVTVLVNLAPRELRGVESQGMILLAEDTDGSLVFVNPDEKNGLVNGLKIS
ncbi:MAG: methionine--tRNA ligase subunit beta, partial [Bacteroidia bacterium]|nr:methionine--tRNA ligase subunit beta [Bacteroidia bacterium]